MGAMFYQDSAGVLHPVAAAPVPGPTGPAGPTGPTGPADPDLNHVEKTGDEMTGQLFINMTATPTGAALNITDGVTNTQILGRMIDATNVLGDPNDLQLGTRKTNAVYIGGDAEGLNPEKYYFGFHDTETPQTDPGKVRAMQAWQNLGFAAMFLQPLGNILVVGSADGENNDTSVRTDPESRRVQGRAGGSYGDMGVGTRGSAMYFAGKGVDTSAFWTNVNDVPFMLAPFDGSGNYIRWNTGSHRVQTAASATISDPNAQPVSQAMIDALDALVPIIADYPIDPRTADEGDDPNDPNKTGNGGFDVASVQAALTPLLMHGPDRTMHKVMGPDGLEVWDYVQPPGVRKDSANWQPQGLDPMALVPVLVGAIQDLRARVIELEAATGVT